MNLDYIRRCVRFSAGAASIAGIAGVASGLLSDGPLSHDDLWGGTVTLVLILSAWVIVETMIACKEEIVAAQPKPRHLVTATIQAMEAEAAHDAGLPHIIGGERLR